MAVSLLSCLGWILKNLYGIWYLFIKTFFPRQGYVIFYFHEFFACFKLFSFVCGSPKICLHNSTHERRLRSLWASDLCSFIIWDVCFVYSSSDYNRIFFSRWSAALLLFSAGCKGAVTLSQANICQVGPLMRVLPDWICFRRSKGHLGLLQETVSNLSSPLPRKSRKLNGPQNHILKLKSQEKCFVDFHLRTFAAHCYCASLLPTLFIRHARATSF